MAKIDELSIKSITLDTLLEEKHIPLKFIMAHNVAVPSFHVFSYYSEVVMSANLEIKPTQKLNFYY